MKISVSHNWTLPGRTAVHSPTAIFIEVEKNDPTEDDFDHVSASGSFSTETARQIGQELINLADEFDYDAAKNNPLISEQIAELKIGTRFVTSDGNEFIKVGTDKYIETDEKLMLNARKLNLGFLNAVDFDGDEGDSRQITIVEN